MRRPAPVTSATWPCSESWTRLHPLANPCVSAGCGQGAAEADLFHAMGDRKTRQGLPRARALNLDAQHGGVFRARRAENGEGGQSLAIEAGDKESFVAIELAPDLADLNSLDGHPGDANESRGFAPDCQCAAT